MSNLKNIYELQENKSEHDLKFFFISKGKQDIVKVIQYSFVQELNGKSIYNLGFGDYDLIDDTISDNTNTNNGDGYKVFNTVLSTIPSFFKNYSSDILMVQGSDGRPEFIKHCKLTCRKQCKDECKNYNRRINIYRGYVDKNYKELSIDYQFFGGIRDLGQKISIEPYEQHKKYDSVFLFKKVYNFTV